MKILITLFLILLCLPFASAYQRGIYLTQSTVENRAKLQHLIYRSKEVGINTFIVDYNKPSKRYHNNIQLLDQNAIHHVARIVIFPGGASPSQVHSERILNKKAKLIEQVAALGADEIQLDYIRFRVGTPASSRNAHDIHRVIQRYKAQTDRLGIPLQIDVFGVAAHGPSRSIGQNLQVFAPSVDVVSPMLYPSHYEPYRQHAKTPYQTVSESLARLHQQFNHHVPFKVIPYIELSNYRYPLSYPQKLQYIRAQIQATKDQNTDGWYAWSAKNHYNVLFQLLASDPDL